LFIDSKTTFINNNSRKKNYKLSKYTPQTTFFLKKVAPTSGAARNKLKICSFLPIQNFFKKLFFSKK